MELKSARGGLPKSLWATYSAFANTSGGSIVLGAAEKADRRVEVQGIDDVDKLLTDFWNKINNPQTVSRNLLGNQNVHSVRSSSGRMIIVINVPRADRAERPVYVGLNPFSGTYRRNHEGDYRCTEAEVRRMFAEQDREETVDKRILPEFGWDDLDPESIAQFRNLFRSAYANHAWLSSDDQVLLEKLGGFRHDRRDGESGITVAGLLMFGRVEAIQAEEGLPGFYLDYRERLSEDPNQRWSDRLTIDYTWEANLFQFYQRVILKLKSGPGIKQPFQTDIQGYRRAATPVHEALQEALVNALIHADHYGQGGIVIDRYVDRIVFSNPGTLLVSREQLLEGGISECRNKALQRMFRMIGAGDQAGSGIDKIRSSWKAQHWQSPRLRETYGPARVELNLPLISTLPGDIIERLQERFEPVFSTLNGDEVQALVAAELEGEITNQRLQEMLALHRVDITEMLRRLVQRDLLAQEGFGRWTRYVPIATGTSPPNLAVSPPNLVESPPNLAVSPPNLVESPPNSDSPSFDESGFEGESQLERLAAPVRRMGRVPRETMRNTILALCEGRFLTLRELCSLLDRQPKTLRDIHISALVKEGLLELRYPDTSSHRNQAYRTRRHDAT